MTPACVADDATSERPIAPPMDPLEALRTFVRVVDAGSFSAVARASGMGQPAISKQIASLEARVGAQLLLRTSHRLRTTDAGQQLYESASHLVEDFETVLSQVQHGHRTPSGLVRLAIAPVLGRRYVLPHLAAFLARYPDLRLETIVTDTERTLDLLQDGVHVVVHNGPLADASVVAKRLGATPVVTVATPKTLRTHGEPKRPRDLAKSPCIAFVRGGRIMPWRFGRSGSVVVPPRASLLTNDAEQIRAAVLADLGFAHTPGWLFARELEEGKVRRILRSHEREPLPLSAVYVGGPTIPTKVRVLVDFLASVPFP